MMMHLIRDIKRILSEQDTVTRSRVAVDGKHVSQCDWRGTAYDVLALHQIAVADRAVERIVRAAGRG